MSGSDSGIDPREPPIFWVAMAGFAREQRDLIEASLQHTSGLASWRVCQIGEADAWLVNGARCRVLSNGNIRVSPGVLSETIVNLDMHTADRPVGFAAPIADANLEPHCTFDANSFTSVQTVLGEFDSSLRFMRAQYALGAEVVERGAALRHGIFHVSYKQNLIAILDFWHGEAALSPHMDPAQVEHAVWAKRPKGVRELPPGFVSSTPAQLAWNYARRSEGNLLPPRYQTRTIHYRQSPRVPVSWLQDSQLRILQELASRSASLSELAERTGALSPELDRDLACLFFAGAITTSQSKAAPPAAAQVYARRPIVAEHARALGPGRPDATVPARLDQQGNAAG